jgi:nucleoside 2-deoxyribosyltransferase
VKTWEDLRIGGKPVINEVLAAVDEADVAVFEVTHLNENVLFEFGYAIARRKVVWPLKDFSDVSRASHWKRLALLA